MTQSGHGNGGGSDSASASKKRERKIAGVIGVAFLAFIVTMCSSAPRQQKAESQQNQITALDRMSLTFKGGPSKSSIEMLMNQTMRWYNHPITEENYMMFGSILLRICQDSRFTEMDVMRCMISMRDAAGPAASPGMYEAAAICSAM